MRPNDSIAEEITPAATREEESPIEIAARLRGQELARKVMRLGGTPNHIEAGSLMLSDNPLALAAYRAEVQRLQGASPAPDSGPRSDFSGKGGR